jgi:RNA polymerase sigma factor (sigma-70 family)
MTDGIDSIDIATFRRVVNPVVPVQDADDVVQECALSALKVNYLPPPSGRRRLLMKKIAERRVMDYYRKRRGRTVAPPEVIDIEGEIDTLVAPSFDHDAWVDVVAWLRDVKPHYREAMLLLTAGFNYREMGEILGVSESAARQRVLRALELTRTPSG